MCDLLRVAVEHQRRPATELADAPLARLAPARMIYVRVHVGIETVFAGVFYVPGSRGLLSNQTDLDDRLDALESILPRHHQTDRRAVLHRHCLTVQSRRTY